MNNCEKDNCTKCYGHGEVLTQGNYADFEPPTKKCTACRGTGDRGVEEAEQDNWEHTIAVFLARKGM